MVINEERNPSALDQSNRCVVFACDEAYAMPLATAITSLVEAYNGNQTLHIFVLSDGFLEGTWKKIVLSIAKSNVSITCLPIDLSPFEAFSILPYTSKMTYARLQIPYLLPSNIQKALYLDADLLVLDDIEKLWDTDLCGSVMAAVLDNLDSPIKANRKDLNDLPRVKHYFNAGVLLLDCNRWIEKSTSERALEYLKNHPSSPFADQDALNAVCDGLWKQLDPRWNFQECGQTKLISLKKEERPGIVHFVMKAKPWNRSIKNLNTMFYDSFRNRTLFARNLRDKSNDFFADLWCNLKGFIREKNVPRFTLEFVRRYRGRYQS